MLSRLLILTRNLRNTLLAVACVFALCEAATIAAEEQLIIGVKIGPSAIDPHYHASGENNTLLPHIYDTLLTLDKDFVVKPSLIKAWRQISTLIWEFDLRENVFFHDGSAFTAKDVAYTFERISLVKHSPGSFEIFTKGIARVETIHPHRIRIHTKFPHPYLTHDLTAIMILPEHLGVDVETAAFNSGKAAIGTGPYQLVNWIPGQKLVLRRNETYWQKTSLWKQVELIQISSDPTRVAALLSAAVDLIDHVPLADRERLGKESAFKIFEHEAARLMFIHMDSDRNESPFVTDHNDKVLGKNPLKDPRVRRALSMALNRAAITKHLLDDAAVPAAQILPASFAGSSQDLTIERYDPEQARALLAQAGYTNGFRLTLHSPSDRYPNDAKVAQAIAQMWWRVGVITQVETLTRNVFFPSAAKQRFSSYFAGWAETTVGNALAGLVHSYDKAKGLGSGNRARYSNPEVDTLIESALVEMDDQHRKLLLARAQEIAFREDQGLIPLYHPTYAWAARSARLHYEANAEGSTQAMRAMPVNNLLSQP